MARGHQYYIENKEKIKEQQKQYCIKNKDSIRERKRLAHFNRKYNLSIYQYEQMFTSQNGKCAICDVDLKTLDRINIHIDHDHKTKFVNTNVN
jgi:hypothetical protein